MRGIDYSLDTKYLFTSLSAQPNSMGRSIRSYVHVINFDFGSGNMNDTLWVSDSQHLAGPGTKENCPLIDAMMQYNCFSLLLKFQLTSMVTNMLQTVSFNLSSKTQK